MTSTTTPINNTTEQESDITQASPLATDLSSGTDQYWRGLVATVESVIQALVNKRKSLTDTQGSEAQRQELASGIHALVLARTGWEMVEPGPGDCAGITLEVASIEDRVQARLGVRKALDFAALISERA